MLGGVDELWRYWSTGEDASRGEMLGGTGCLGDCAALERTNSVSFVCAAVCLVCTGFWMPDPGWQLPLADAQSVRYETLCCLVDGAMSLWVLIVFAFCWMGSIVTDVCRTISCFSPLLSCTFAHRRLHAASHALRHADTLLLCSGAG